MVLAAPLPCRRYTKESRTDLFEDNLLRNGSELLGGTEMKKPTRACVVIALLLTSTYTTEAQEPAKIPRIGFLHAGTSGNAPKTFEAFKQGLRDRGYIEGKNIHIEDRWGQYKPERLPQLAAELVALNVDVIVTSQTPNVKALKKATSTIPIVFCALSFPVENGISPALLALAATQRD